MPVLHFPAADERVNQSPLARYGDEPAGYQLVPKVEARLAAGSGSFETSDKPLGWYAFLERWTRAKGLSSRLVLMEVSGDSMEPEIRNRDTALIDQAQNEPVAGGIFVVRIDEVVVVKMVDKAPGKLILRSYNPAYPPMELDLKDQSLDFSVIGRVVWWCREAR